MQNASVLPRQAGLIVGGGRGMRGFVVSGGSMGVVVLWFVGNHISVGLVQQRNGVRECSGTFPHVGDAVILELLLDALTMFAGDPQVGCDIEF